MAVSKTKANQFRILGNVTTSCLENPEVINPKPWDVPGAASSKRLAATPLARFSSAAARLRKKSNLPDIENTIIYDFSTVPIMNYIINYDI